MPAEISAPIDVAVEVSRLKAELATSNRQKIEQQEIIDDLKKKLNAMTILARASPSYDPAENFSRYPRSSVERELTLERLKRKQSDVQRIKMLVEQGAPTNFEPKCTSTPAHTCVDDAAIGIDCLDGEDKFDAATNIQFSTINNINNSSENDLTNNNKVDSNSLKDQLALDYKDLTLQRNAAADCQLPPKGAKTRIYNKLFGGLSRRSTTDDYGPTTFKRNGLRATTGPRLEFNSVNNKDSPVAKWTENDVSKWLNNQGMAAYIGHCKRSHINGDILIKSNSSKLNKMLGITNYYHRKKLQFALQAAISCSQSNMDNMTYKHVCKWLDDIGLPQYQDKFEEARIDGRMLHYLTVEDLMGLKVNNVLHHLSFKSGIQVLREQDYDLVKLKRRSVYNDMETTPEDVSLWTSHRVMEWLKTIDFTEYASNLRGAGVHGALMVREATFGAEVFACLLSIPANKSLLRRHLTEKFVKLVGVEMQKKKREIESDPSFSKLTRYQKLKKKNTIFSSKRNEFLEYVCPMTSEVENISAYTIDRKHASNNLQLQSNKQI